MPFENFQIRICSNYSTSVIMRDILIQKWTGTFVVLGTTTTTQEVGAFYVFQLFLSFLKGRVLVGNSRFLLFPILYSPNWENVRLFVSLTILRTIYSLLGRAQILSIIPNGAGPF